MRVTLNITYDRYLHNIKKGQVSIHDLNTKLATGKKVNKPSDDPVATKDIMSARSALSEMDRYEKNIDFGLGYLGAAENALNSFKDALASIREMAASAANGLNDASTRKDTAAVVKGLREHLVNLSNTMYEDEYIFAGYETNAPPFNSAGAYSGDSNSLKIKTSASTTMTLGMNGGTVFKGAGGGVDVFQKVNDFITALESNDQAGVMTSIQDLESASNQISNSVSDIGGKASRLNAAGSDLKTARLELQKVLSTIEDADITDIISKLSLYQASLEASMASAGKLFKLNILDYI